MDSIQDEGKLSIPPWPKIEPFKQIGLLKSFYQQRIMAHDLEEVRLIIIIINHRSGWIQAKK